MKCPNCSKVILKENINIQTDVAQCNNCDNIFKLSETIGNERLDEFDFKSPPSGAWIREEINSLVIGATTRSPIAFFLVPFMLVWSGASIGGIYGTQLANGEFDPFMSLFGLPFLIGSIIFWSVTLMAIWGKVELTLNREGGQIFTGLGDIGLKKKFTWDEISTINEVKSNLNYPGSQGSKLQLEGKKRISFGRGVNDSRLYYLFRTMKYIISQKKLNKNFV